MDQPISTASTLFPSRMPQCLKASGDSHGKHAPQAAAPMLPPCILHEHCAGAREQRVSQVSTPQSSISRVLVPMFEREVNAAEHRLASCIANARNCWDITCHSLCLGKILQHLLTCPVMATSGTLSIMASARPVTRLVAPGPLVAMHTPTRPVVLA